jgi:hypothetical protein
MDRVHDVLITAIAQNDINPDIVLATTLNDGTWIVRADKLDRST